MKVLLVGEGTSDVGIKDFWSPKLKEYISLDGWLQAIIRNVRAAPEMSFSITTRVDLKLDPKVVKRLQPLPKGHGAKALLAKRAAIVGEYDVLIFLVDCDSNSPARWREIVKEVDAGFAALDGLVTCIACVPMAMSESWLLSDAASWSSAASYTGPLPAKPESLWGPRDDPQGGHPHQVFARVCREADVPDDREIRNRVAAAAAPSTWATACPRSFPPFADAILAA